MKLLWLCNMAPGAVREAEGQESSGGLWLDQVLTGLRRETESEVCVLFPGQSRSGRIDGRLAYAAFPEQQEHIYYPALESFFEDRLREICPEVIHIWGTEYGHTLAMVNAAEKLGLSGRVVVSIQGLCSVITPHYLDGVPERVCRGVTFRDFVRRDNLLRQKEKFALRGEMETKALRKVTHVIGRTDWDRDLTGRIHPDRCYHFCNETLRETFFLPEQWRYDRCRRHTIFASSCSYPVKGFHVLLEAFRIVLRLYPDAAIRVTGESFLRSDLRTELRRSSYSRYLRRFCREHRLEDRLEFLGALSAEQMKQAYLDANVFVLPSTIENSPNSLGEAMLLGTPAVAANVGGVNNLLHPGEGFLCPPLAPEEMAERICEIFAMEDRAEEMGQRARTHALRTHDPEQNLQDLLKIYQIVRKGTDRV